VREAADVTKRTLFLGGDVGADDVALKDAVFTLLYVERWPPPLPVHVEILAAFEFLAEAGFRKLFALLL